jgi:hypothetical protein
MKSPPSQNSDTPTIPLRVGVLGCSDIARRKFIPALARCERGVLAAISSRTPAKAAAAVADCSSEILSHEELLACPGVDLVYLSLPNHLHEEWALRVLAAGKHLLCEKPLGLSPESVERMLLAAEQHGLLLYENLMFLHHPQHAVVRELVCSGRIGRIRALRAVFTIPFPKSGDFRLDPMQGGARSMTRPAILWGRRSITSGIGSGASEGMPHTVTGSIWQWTARPLPVTGRSSPTRWLLAASTSAITSWSARRG